MDFVVDSAGRRFRGIAMAATMAAVLCAPGCSVMSEEDKEERAYRHAEFEANFRKYERWCHSMGRQVVIQAGLGPDRRGVPTPGDYYTCT